MDQNRFHEKSYHKAKTVRKLIRHQLFEKNRKISSLTYLNYYDADTRQTIQQSMQGPVPVSLPPASQVVRSTISYYRRMGIPVFKTRLQQGDQLDPHMVYQSLWSLAGVENISQYSNAQEVVKQFEQQFSQYMMIPYKQIQQAALIAAGNRIKGKPEDILKAVQNDDNNLWILLNHVFQANISHKALFVYLPRNVELVYRAIFQMTNLNKHQIIYDIIQNQQVLTVIISAFCCGNEEIEKLAIRIVGNILGQAEDYAGDITKYQILQRIYPKLSSQIADNRRDALWLLANYAYQSGGAKQITYKQIMMERILTLFRYEPVASVKSQVYFLLSHLVQHGDKLEICRIALQERFLQQCGNDLEIEDQDLNIVVLNLIQNLIELGEEFVDHQSDNEEENTNAFIREIKNVNLSGIIMSKTYSQNQQISQISINIIDQVEAEDNQFGRI